MAKVIINEEELHQLITEGIQEVLSEAWGQNFFSNLAQKAANINKAGGLTPYFAGKVGGAMGRYTNWRDNISNSFRNAYKSALGNNQSETPSTENNSSEIEGPSAQETLSNTIQQSGTTKSSSAPPAQNGNATPRGNTNMRNNVQSKAQQILQQKSNFLKQKGFQLVNGQWTYTKDGSNSPALQSQYPDIVQAAKSYNMALKGARGMYEAKLKSLKKQINEIKDAVSNKKAGK